MKCFYCKTDIQAGDSLRLSGHFYHKDCAEAAKQAAMLSFSQETAKAEDPDFLSLSRYLCSFYHIQKLTPLLQKQIKTMKQEEGWSYSKIKLMAYYWLELCYHDNDETRVPNIGILPFIEKDAEEYFTTTQSAQAYNDSFIPTPQNITIRSLPKSKEYRATFGSIDDL